MGFGVGLTQTQPEPLRPAERVDVPGLLSGASVRGDLPAADCDLHSDAGRVARPCPAPCDDAAPDRAFLRGDDSMTTNPLDRIAARNGGTMKRDYCCGSRAISRPDLPSARHRRRAPPEPAGLSGCHHRHDAAGAGRRSRRGTSCSSTPRMFALYDNAAKIFRSNILARHPLILALFSGAGGRMILYRPGKPPVEAPSVPIVYQVHEVDSATAPWRSPRWSCPILDNAADKSWVAPMLAYRTADEDARSTASTPCRIQADWKPSREDHPEQQRRLHGRLPGQGRDHDRGAAGLRQEAGAGHQARSSTGRPRPRSSTGWA